MTRTLRPVGNVGLAAAIALVILNLAHPFDGTTEMYGDAVLFISKMDTWWVIDHLALAFVFLFFPWVTWAWVQTLQDGRAQLWGRLGWMTMLIGTAIGVLHVGGIDGVALPSFGTVLEGSNGGAETAAAALLRVHLTTFMAWLIVAWVGASLFLGLATLLEPDQPQWLGWMLVLAAALGLASAIVTALEGQLTTLSEPFLFRPSSFLVTIWLLIVSLQLRRTDQPAAAPRS
ncbi:MAG: hypothetical protein ACLFRT_09650 [Actinomycetota bacterium]